MLPYGNIHYGVCSSVTEHLLVAQGVRGSILLLPIGVGVGCIEISAILSVLDRTESAGMQSRYEARTIPCRHWEMRLVPTVSREVRGRTPWFCSPCGVWAGRRQHCIHVGDVTVVRLRADPRERQCF